MAISGGMISNPKRSVSVEMGIDALKKRIRNLHKVYKSIDMNYPENKEDDFTNTFQYKIKDGGLSFGTRAIIMLKRESDTTTTIEVELQRIVGSYDTDHEVSQANEQLNAIFNGLSVLSKKTDDELDTLVVADEEQIETGIGAFGTAIIVIASILGFILFLSI